MKLILIDGYGFVFRAFHALPPLTRPKDGIPIGAVAGFTNILYKFINRNSEDAIAVVLDAGTKNFRHEIYPQYKANRTETPDDLIVQLPIIREAIESFNIKALEKPGFEADDLIASYAKEAINKGIEVEIVSSDKDLMQLISEGIKMFDAMKDREISEEYVLSKFGVPPSQLKDVLALMGDSSDNIPGVRGIGPKTAAELINKYGSLEGIYKNLDQITQQKRRDMLITDKDNAFLSYRLVTLDSNVSLDFDIMDLKKHELDKAKLSHFLIEQGFKSLLSRLESNNKSTEPSASTIVFEKLNSTSDIKNLFPYIEYYGQLYLHIEDGNITLSIGNKNYSLQIASNEKQGSFFEDDNPDLISITSALEALRPIMESRSITVVSINSKEICKALLTGAKNSLNMPNYIEDIAIIAYSLETGVGDCSFEDLIYRFAPKNTNKNSHTIKAIYQELLNKIIEAKHMSLYKRIDRPLLLSLARMEVKGVKIDVSYLDSLSVEFRSKIRSLEKEIYSISGKEFNIGSPKQISDILFHELKLPFGKKSKTGNYITSASVLEHLVTEGHQIAKLILEWRKYTKLVSTYTDALPKAINKTTGRVHTNFAMTATATGRLSSNEPNLQNIPIRTEEGHRIRKAFIAESGNQIISADYSQIELRLLAHFANIPVLKEAFKHGHDIHSITASQIFNIPVGDVNSEARRQAKAINFGIIYGMGAYGLARRLDISREAAHHYIENYFVQYPGIKEYMDTMISYAKMHGYVQTFFGRKCYIKGINDKNQAIRGNAERAAINFPLQGTAADIIKKAMVNLPIEVSRYMILQVHDELLFEVPAPEVDSVTKIIKTKMEGAIKLDGIPIVVDIRHGNNWMESH